jgi:hypothetical protein
MATKTVVNLGDEAQDPITGYKGVCICRTEWISGCTRIGLQAPMGKDGKVPDPQHFDEPMLKVLKTQKFAPTAKDTGGPRPAPVSAPAAKR